MAKIGDRAGMWECPYCETPDIWGYIFECTGCGVSRPKGVRFYLPKNAPLLTGAQIAAIGSNPNWYCEFCESGNRSKQENCWECGAEKGESSTHRKRTFYTGVAPSTAAEAEEMALHAKPYYTPTVAPAPTTTTSTPPTASRGTDRYERSYPTQAYETNQRTGYDSKEEPRNSIFANVNTDALKPIATILAGIVGISLVAFLIYQFFFNTHAEQVQISSFNWTQNVTVQEYQVVNESSWGSYPNGAYNVTEEYKDTGRDEKIHDGYHMEDYQSTCYKDEDYQSTCYKSVYESKSCPVDNGDGSFGSKECGSYVQEPYSCTETKQVSYSCTKEKQVEDFHYEDIYDWYYEYDINKWQTIANYPTSGTDHSPYFETGFVLNEPYSGLGNPQIGQQQQFEVPGEYTVTFFCPDNLKIGKEGYFTRSHPQGTWEAFDGRGVYPIEVNTFNSVLTYPTP
jgi:hypothetical protein